MNPKESTDGDKVYQVSHLDQIHDAPAISHLPKSTADSPATLADFWENRRVLCYCLLIFLLPINFGYEAGAIGKLFAVPAFQRRFGYAYEGTWLIKATDQQILGAAGPVSSFISAFAAGFISDLIGRKYTIGLGACICLGGVIWQYHATSILVLFGAKIVGALGYGLGNALAPVLVAELAPVKLRGICLTLVNTMIVLGAWLNSLAILACDHYHDDMSWRIPLITQAGPPSLLLLFLVLLPESPAWLIIKGREEEAAQSFRRYNGPNFDVASAVAVAKAAVEQEKIMREQQKNSGWLECFHGTNLRRTMVNVGIYSSQQFVGVGFVTGYLPYYFSLAGVKNPLAVAQGAFAIQLAGNIASWFLVDRIGRRPLFSGGAYIMTALLLLIGGLSTVKTKPVLAATTALMCIWGLIYNMSIGAVAYAICGETPSVELRQKTFSINMMVATTISTGLGQAMPYLINTDKLNLGGKVCFIYFGLSLPICFWLFFCLPELKGRNYAEIQEMFNNKVPARKFKTYVCEVSSHGDMTDAKGKDEV
ncbi:hypothetical protein FALCPG4_012598 [Fusarium falciforme]